MKYVKCAAENADSSKFCKERGKHILSKKPALSAILAVISLFAMVLPFSGCGGSTNRPPSNPISSATKSPAPITTTTATSISWATVGAMSVNADTNAATYKSNGVDISAYLYKPEGAGPFPAVLVLHGGLGLTKDYRLYASWLATQGYVALAPDYMSPLVLHEWTGSEYLTYTDPARAILAQGLEALKSLPYVDAEHVAIIGFSLGGYFAFLLGTRSDLKAVVSYYGAYIPDSAAKYRFADIVAQINEPVLMFHGDADSDVPISAAYTTRDLLTSFNKQFDFIVYPGVGHLFNFAGQATFDANAAQDSQQKVLAFLNTTLH